MLAVKRLYCIPYRYTKAQSEELRDCKPHRDPRKMDPKFSAYTQFRVDHTGKRTVLQVPVSLGSFPMGFINEGLLEERHITEFGGKKIFFKVFERNQHKRELISRCLLKAMAPK